MAQTYTKDKIDQLIAGAEGKLYRHHINLVTTSTSQIYATICFDLITKSSTPFNSRADIAAYLYNKGITGHGYGVICDIVKDYTTDPSLYSWCRIYALTNDTVQITYYEHKLADHNGWTFDTSFKIISQIQIDSSVTDYVCEIS